MSTEIPRSQPGDPVWEIATLFSPQGQWTASEYLALETNRLIEFNDGQLEFVPMPTELHQLIAFHLCSLLRNLGDGNPPGVALMAPFRIRVSPLKYREPDVVFMLNENRDRRKSQYWEGADLVMEILSDDDPQRDLITKRSEYSEAKILEYWIVDPAHQTIRVLVLDNGASEYRESGDYGIEEVARSQLLPDLRVVVKSVFDQKTE